MKCTNNKKNKTIFSVLVIIILILSIILVVVTMMSRKNKVDSTAYNRSQQIFGSEKKERAIIEDGIASDLCVGKENTPLEGIKGLEGESSGFFDLQQKSVLYSQNMHERISPGKLTQIMTVLTAYGFVEEEDMVVMPSGQETTVMSIINAILVSSDKDLAITLANACTSSVDDFVESMNQKARTYGMTNTHYTNVTGNGDEEQYTTVYDTYLLFNQLLQHNELINAMGLSGFIMNHYKSNGDLKQVRIDTDNPYLTGALPVPKNVTVLGGKFTISKIQNATVLLVQNQYGNAFVLIVTEADNERTMNTRIWEMLEKVNS